jgi:hypothetical protein
MPAMNPGQLFRRQEQRRPAARVVIEDSEASTITPEGVAAKMPLRSLLAQVSGTRANTADFILPDGVKAVIPRGRLTVCVWESPPRVQSLTWITNDSPAPFGALAKYRQVRIAMPYLIILAVFDTDRGGGLQLSGRNECFFRNAPLKSLDEELCYPALLNCYQFGPWEPKPLSWICAGGLKPTPSGRSPNATESMLAGLARIRQYLLDTRFNHSDGQGGRLSWFEASRSLDPRLSAIEAWEEASARDPLFVLDIPWIKSGHTVRQAIQRMSDDSHRLPHEQPSAETLVRLILNHQASPQPLPFAPKT